MKLGYYPGCSLHSTGIEYDLSARVVAGRLGIELEEIEGWVCCGSSPAHARDEIMSLALPAKNMALLKEENGLAEVCVPCASCYSRMKFAQARMRDPRIRSEIEEVIGGRAPVDVTVYHMLDAITQRVGPDAVRKRMERSLGGMRIACYYGCLMTRPPKITGKSEYENPLEMEALLEAAGATPVEWNLKTACCGASFALTEIGVVLAMTRKILEDAVAAGAEAIAVGCPLCHSNLDARQEQINAGFSTAFSMPVFYFTELLGLALGATPRSLGIPRHMTDAEGFLRQRGWLK